MVHDIMRCQFSMMQLGGMQWGENMLHNVMFALQHPCMHTHIQTVGKLGSRTAPCPVGASFIFMTGCGSRRQSTTRQPETLQLRVFSSIDLCTWCTCHGNIAQIGWKKLYMFFLVLQLWGFSWESVGLPLGFRWSMTPAFWLKPIAFNLGAVDGCLGPSATLRKLVAAGALAVPRDFPGDWPLTVGHPGGVASIERHEGPNFYNMGMVRAWRLLYVFFAYIHMKIYYTYIYILSYSTYTYIEYMNIYTYYV